MGPGPGRRVALLTRQPSPLPSSDKITDFFFRTTTSVGRWNGMAPRRVNCEVFRFEKERERSVSSSSSPFTIRS